MRTAIMEPTHENRRSASEKIQEYTRARERGIATPADLVVERVSRAIVRGHRLLSLSASMRLAGVDERGRPKLALARADMLWCRFRWNSGWHDMKNGERAPFSEFRGGLTAWHVQWSPCYKAGYGRSLLLPRSLFPTELKSDLLAQVPPVPPRHRPKGHLSRYFILWEAEWEDVPKDPLLLRRISTDWFIVVAEWNLTEVERLVLSASLFAESFNS